MEKIVQNDFKLHFRSYPTDEEIKTLVRINKNLSDNNQTALNKARKAIEEISKNNPDEEIKMKLIILYREQN